MTNRFAHGYYWVWIPVLLPFVGAPLGAFAYKLFVENHWPEREQEEECKECKCRLVYAF